MERNLKHALMIVVACYVVFFGYGFIAIGS
ncbi:YnhF family membrane protein [Vibrio xiamenensis]